MSELERAKVLACKAHAGQADKAGRAYIEHVSRVAYAVSDDPKAETVAWLHDVMEDCGDEYKNAILHDFGYSIFWSVHRLTRHKRQSSKKYYDDIKEDPIALRVKLADIADNSDPERLALLGDDVADRLRRKYRKAINCLTTWGFE